MLKTPATINEQPSFSVLLEPKCSICCCM